MLHLTNSEVHIIMGNTHAIAKKSTFIKKHPTLHIQNYAGNSYSAAGYKKTGYNSGKSASLNELRGKFYIKEPGSAITHFIGMIMALIAAFPLLIKAAAQPDPVYLISMSVYAASLILLYAASTTYHTFDISEKEFGFEIHLRAVLSEIWIRIFQQAVPLLAQPPKLRKNNDKIKDLMIYVHQHYSEKLVISQLASAVFLSERECFRIFQECLHMTPMQYIQNYRLQMACQMLAETRASVTEISHACGLGSSSYFGKVFREYMNCTPGEYRQKTEHK